VSRIDKYDPVDGGFRAPLAADLTSIAATGNGNPLGVSLDANGRVVIGTAAPATRPIIGLLLTNRNLKAGDVVDVMTDGEMVELASLVAGQVYWVTDATGVLTATGPGAGVNLTRAGHTVEATRLVVRVAPNQG
jgi:hypothetical protein